MPSLTASSPSSSPPQKDLPGLLEAARPFLRGEPDPALAALVSTLASAGAGECWHKHGTFLAHLTDVHRVLRLWGAPDPVALCGLYHSAYSNSYVNLAIFDPSTSRDHVRALIGAPAERLVHLFCVVNRQTLIHDDLLFKYSDGQLVEHLACSQSSLQKARENGVFDDAEPWRKQLQALVPAEGIRVKHIRTGEDVAVSRRVVAAFVMMTMADFSDQLFGFQDQLFDNENGRLEFTGNSPATALWPGNGKPGLWLNSISRMGALYTLLLREEEIYLEERKRAQDLTVEMPERDEDIDLVIPPVFDNCTRVLNADDQISARDLYWEAVYGGGKQGLERVEELLLKCIERNPFVGEPHVVLGQVYLGMGRFEEGEVESEKGLRLLLECIERNPFVGEPHVVLGQVYLGMGRFEEGEVESEKGLRLLLEWGSGWDKRVSWEGWVAWGRVMLMKAKERDWPQTAWGILNLGLVR